MRREPCGCCKRGVCVGYRVADGEPIYECHREDGRKTWIGEAKQGCPDQDYQEPPRDENVIYVDMGVFIAGRRAPDGRRLEKYKKRK